MLNKYLLVLMVVGLFTFAACQSNAAPKEAPTDTAPVEEAQAAPTTSAKTADYPFEIVTSFDQLAPIFNRDSDSTYVINFWATWCKPCVEELPYFEQLHDDFSGEKLKVILVSLDFAKDIDRKLVPFVEEHKLRSEVIALLDGQYNNWIDKVDPEWSGAIPVTVLYNAKERKFIGEQFSGYDELSGLVTDLLKT
ncbi:MAG: TlpA disulfide reductase family protein [Bacteroidota bacterium]